MRTARTVSTYAAAFLFFTSVAAADPTDDEKKIDLKVGDPAPRFEVRDDGDKSWSSTDHVGKKIVVIYFYPADFTSGCMAQAQKFRDGMNQLVEKGVVVIGVSGDHVATHELFKKVQKLNFTLLADENGEVAKKFGVPLGKGGEVRPRDAMNKPILDDDGKPLVVKRDVTAARWTFIIGKDGTIVYKNTKVNPTEDTKQVTAFIEQMKKE
jgi:thioredoxin-dependent peroxiredoxin